MKRTALAWGLGVGLALADSTGAWAQGCADYPFGNGMNIDTVDGGVRIIATASVGVSFDDVDSLNDARAEAQLAARAMIVRFMTESIQREEEVRRAVQETRSMQGDAQQAVRNETIQRVRNLAGNAAGMLRGAVDLGECYTPRREMRVSVGMKPETIAQAEGLSGQVQRSLSTQPAPGSRSTTSQGASDSVSQTPAQGGAAGPNRVPGFSDTQRLNRF